nr:DUF397 domain-containing protein [Streptomyces jietaisiensis]
MSPREYSPLRPVPWPRCSVTFRWTPRAVLGDGRRHRDRVAEVDLRRGPGNECVELARAEPSLLLRESEEPRRVLAVRADALVGLLRYVRRESR